MKLLLDKERCTGCRMCVKVCPQKLFEVVDKKAQVNDESRCMGCFGCEDECEEGAVRLLRAPQHVEQVHIEPPPVNITQCDVAVVGSGPAGLGAAITCAKAGLDVVVFERLPNRQLAHHTDGGIMFTLPGVTSIKNQGDSVHMPELDISLQGDIAKQISYVGLVGPGGISTINDFPTDIEGWAQNKNAFVHGLADEAERYGAKLWYNCKVSDVIKEGDQVCGVILESGQQIRSKVVVTADGVHAYITEKAGFPVSRSNPWYIAALTYEFDNIWPDLPLGYHYLAGGMEPEEQMAPGYSSAQGALGVTDTIHVAMGFLTSQKEYPAQKPLDYYVQRVIDTDPRVHKVMGDRLFGRKPDMITGCRVMFRERHLEDTVGNGVIAVGDAWVDDCDLGNIPSLANGVHAGRVIALAAKAGDFSKKALDAANDFKSEPVLKYLAQSKKDKLCGTVLNEKEMEEYFKFCKHLHYPPLVFGDKKQKGKALTKFMIGNAFRFLKVIKYPKLKNYVLG